MRIADAVALRALDDPGAEAAEADADARLARLGIDANGWRCAFAHAAGLTAVAGAAATCSAAA